MNHDLDYYRKIQGVNGSASAKESEIRLIKNELSRDFFNSIDCESVTVNGTNAYLLITRSTDETIKKVVSMPDESIYLGDVVSWLSTDWIIDSIDADNRINSRGKMRRCNVVLKWIDENGDIHSHPGFCEDATKYSEGVSGGKMIQIGEFQLKIKIHLDANSAKINRDKRFLIDASSYLPQLEVSGSHPSAYAVTRRNVLTGNHNGHGYVELTLVECAYSENDNSDLMLADYYSADDVYALTVTNVSDDLVVAKDATFTISASATLNGEALDQTSILFQTSDSSVATVSSLGVVTGVANGTCVITAKAGNARHVINLIVQDASETAEIKIFADDDVIIYGQSKRIEFKAYVDGAETATTFSTSLSGDAASITDSGSGYVVITAADDSGNIGETFTLTVASEGLSASTTKTFTVRGWF